MDTSLNRIENNVFQVHIHGKTGRPLPYHLTLDDHQLILKPSQRLTSLFSSSIFTVPFSTFFEIHPGRQTTNFLRTSKYIAASSLPESDTHCFSFILNTNVSYDLECNSVKECERLLVYLTTKSGITNTNVAATGVSQPHGLSHFCYKLSQTSFFINFILICILLNTCIMAAQSPVEENETIKKILSYLDKSILLIFTLELGMKVAALEGLLPLLHDPWDVLDTLIVSASWFSEFPLVELSFNVSAFRAFRAIKALKYLKGIQEILETFAGTMKMVTFALFTYFYFLFLYAILAVHLFRNAMDFQCASVKENSIFSDILNMSVAQNNTIMVPRTFCVPDRGDCGPHHSCLVRSLSFNPDGFNTLSQSLFTLYRITSRAGLTLPLNATMATTSPLSLLFFITLIVFVSYMILALFVAIVRASFVEMKTKRDRAVEVRNQLAKSYASKDRPEMNYEVSSLKKISKRVESTIGRSWDSLVRLQRGTTSFYLKLKMKSPKVLYCFHRKGKVVKSAGIIIHHFYFEIFILVLIVANTTFLALDYHEMPRWYATMLTTAENCFTVLFALEMMLKIIGLKGLYKYLYSGEAAIWNKFDAVIVIGGCIDLFLTTSGLLTGAGGIVSLLRSVRLLRIIRILRTNVQLMQVITAIYNSLTAMFNLLLFMMMVTVVFAILGMQLYGGTFALSSRNKFDTFFEALLTLFRMFSGGGTWGIYYEASESSSGSTAPLFFLTFNVFSVYVTLNFMIVILLKSFQLSLEEILTCRNEELRFHVKAFRHQPSSLLLLVNARVVSDTAMLTSLTSTSRLSTDSIYLFETEEKKVTNSWKNNACFLFPLESTIRKSSTFLVCKSEAFILVCIVLSSICLALESPGSRGTWLANTIKILDIVFLWIFNVEFIVKVISTGFVLGPKTYLSVSWNRLDFFVLLFSNVGYILPSSGIGSYFRIGRILRPLRVIGRNRGLQVLIRSILKSAHEVCYALVLMACIFFMFAILGMNLFSGQIAKCNDANMINRIACIGIFENSYGVTTPRVWSTGYHNFNDIGHALRSLFEVVAGKSWIHVMFATMDITGVDRQPIVNERARNALFFVLFIFISSFYMLKIFVGIVVANFRRFNGSALLTPQQLQWVQLKNRIATLEPPMASSTNTSTWVTFLHSMAFQNSITVLIWIQAVFLGMNVQPLYKVGHVLVVMVLVLDIVARMHTIGFYHYVTTFRYAFTTTTVCLMIVLPACDWLHPLGYLLALIRVFQFYRLYQVFYKLDGLKKLLVTLVSSTPLTLQICSLFALVLFIYATLGMQLFGTVKWGIGFNNTMNFTTFPQALLTLFRIASGDDWTIVLKALRISPPYCTEEISGQSERSDCGFPIMASLYFYSYFVLVFLVFLNLYVAAILDTYTSTNTTAPSSQASSGASSSIVDEVDLLGMVAVWTRFDPKGTGSIPRAKLPEVLSELHTFLNWSSVTGNKDHCVVDKVTLHLYYLYDNYISIGKHMNSYDHFVQCSFKKIVFREFLVVVCRLAVPKDYLTCEERLELVTLDCEASVSWSLRILGRTFRERYKKQYSLLKNNSKRTNTLYSVYRKTNLNIRV